MINSLTLFLMGVLAISEKDITQDYIFRHQGLWMHPSQQYVVRLEGCENGMCGTIAWLADNAAKHDVNNIDETQRGRPLCGLRIVSGLATDGHVNIYKNGKIYRTDTGKMTSVKASYVSSQEVQMHSYQGVSMVGDTQIWMRVEDRDYPPCTPAEPLVVHSNVTSESMPLDILPQDGVGLVDTSGSMIPQSQSQTRAILQTKTNYKSGLDNNEDDVPDTLSSAKEKSTEPSAPRVLTLEVVE